MYIEKLLEIMLQNKASDLHISATLVPMMRIDGEIIKIDLPEIDKEKTLEIIYSILNEEQKEFFIKNKEIDLAYSYKNKMRLRINFFLSHKGPCASIRAIPNKILSLEQLNAPDILKKICQMSKGLVLVTGPTGSGKSTTLAAMIDYINTIKKCHIITIEDPIEFVHKSKLSLINQRELKKHTLSFDNALKASLREDPDVILIGEMRDLETIRLALTAAETGHLVLATLHTTGATRTIDRIVDVFPGNEKDLIRKLVSESLYAVISQILIKQHNKPGRVAAHEILISNCAVRNLIRENKIYQIASNIQTGSQYGMLTLEASLNKLIDKKIITHEFAKSILINNGYISNS